MYTLTWRAYIFIRYEDMGINYDRKTFAEKTD